MNHPGWPARFSDGAVCVRPLRLTDVHGWRRLRRDNVEWLRPWEATSPAEPWPPTPSLSAFLRVWWRTRREAVNGLSLPFVICLNGRLIGQVTVAGISRLPRRSNATIGYWVDHRYAGQGITPTALRLVVPHCFDAVGLVELEANVRPENAASRRVMDKLGFTVAGVRSRFLYVDGDWRDHIRYRLTRSEQASGTLAQRPLSTGE